MMNKNIHYWKRATLTLFVSLLLTTMLIMNVSATSYDCEVYDHTGTQLIYHANNNELLVNELFYGAVDQRILCHNNEWYEIGPIWDWNPGNGNFIPKDNVVSVGTVIGDWTAMGTDGFWERDLGEGSCIWAPGLETQSPDVSGFARHNDVITFFGNNSGSEDFRYQDQRLLCYNGEWYASQNDWAGSGVEVKELGDMIGEWEVIDRGEDLIWSMFETDRKDACFWPPYNDVYSFGNLADANHNKLMSHFGLDGIEGNSDDYEDPRLLCYDGVWRASQNDWSYWSEENPDVGNEAWAIQIYSEGDSVGDWEVVFDDVSNWFEWRQVDNGNDNGRDRSPRFGFGETYEQSYVYSDWSACVDGSQSRTYQYLSSENFGDNFEVRGCLVESVSEDSNVDGKTSWKAWLFMFLLIGVILLIILIILVSLLWR